MKKIILAVAIFAFTAPVVIAQDAAKQQRMHSRERLTPERRAALQTETMSQKLDLTPEQKQRVERINLESAKDMQPVIEQRSEQNNRIRQMDQQRMDQYRKVLTPEQMTEYRKMRSREGNPQNDRKR